MEIELVANARDVTLFLLEDNPHRENLQDLQNQGVILAAVTTPCDP